VTRYVALLRAVNLAGRSQVSMAALRDLVTAMGYASVRTLLQSGNIVFEADSNRPAELERLLASEVAQRLGISTDIFAQCPRMA
jgi:uncharacterized protein (DUF1697 family)